MQTESVHQGCSDPRVRRDAFTELVPLHCLTAAAFRCLCPSHLNSPGKKVYDNAAACLGGGQDWDGDRNLYPTICLHQVGPEADKADDGGSWHSPSFSVHTTLAAEP